ncbi:hypothetical protein [Yinghuangia soli]|uniref:Uncharacterized protein n=1 Tax=Yinghuangia soli TaxID=2908204 RepID=A0AA41PVG4_9ACTN|nr:hypothetical protein [Yinghuangia soli]MCF2526609.1 hypothetical protein [Yinghuangia soli]
MSWGVDMAGGADVLGIVADFLVAHPALPELVGVQVTWHHADKAWQVNVQLAGGNVTGLAGWAAVLRGPVTTVVDGDGAYIGPYTRHEVTGLLRGHPVTVWACERRGLESA